MKNRIKQYITLCIIAIFLTFSSGLVITIHHCCHAHHHAVNDHHHCHDDVYILKITDHYNISASLHIDQSPQTNIFFLNNEIAKEETLLCNNYFHYIALASPLPILAGNRFLEFVPHRIYYC